jgi:23S rRNA pseudouridine1911/1915/1917 synthase
VARSSVRLHPGQQVELSVPEPRPAIPAPEDIPLSVLYEDSRLLVLDKPAGLVVHPGAGRTSGTLVNALLHQVTDLSGVGGVLRPGIVHRLDRGTSGLLVVAKDDAAHRALARQFADRSVEKEYLALVLGVPARAHGTIEATVGRDPVHRRRMSVRSARGREARSTWTTVEALDGAALLRVRIHTGRTHQIRVHLASIGHPVAGDDVYGGRRTPPSRRAESRRALEALERPALHAARLAFVHPGTGRRVEFESPLPEDIRDAVERLRG